MSYSVNTELLKKADCTSEINVSLNGVMPESAGKRIDIEPGKCNPGFCACVAESSTSAWEITPGCEELLNKIYLVVKSTLYSIVRKTAEKFKVICKRMKSMVRFSAPRFLRL